MFCSLYRSNVHDGIDVMKKMTALNSSQLSFQILFVCLADALVGVSYGALAISLGFDLWVPLSLSILVLAGASEFLFIGIIASGGGAVTAAIAGLLVNSRLLAFGLSLNTQLGKGWRRFFGCHLMNDESVVFGISQQNSKLNKRAYWLSGLGILIAWPLGVYFGAVLGEIIESTHALGLDVMFPAILIALVLPKLTSSTMRVTASTGAVLCVASTPFLPAGIPALLSLMGIFMKRVTKNG